MPEDVFKNANTTWARNTSKIWMRYLCNKGSCAF